MGNQDLLYKMLEYMLALANSEWLLASVVVWYVRKRKHCKGTARHRTQGTTPHGTARRCAAPLS